MARILKTEIKTNIGLKIVNEYVDGTSSSTSFFKDDVIEDLNYVKDSEVVTATGRLESIGAEIIPNQKKKYERLTDPIADRLKLNSIKLDMSTAMFANQVEVPTREILEFKATAEVKRVKILPVIEVGIKVTLSDGTVTATTLKEGMECNDVKLLGADGDNKMDFIIGAFVYSINPETLEVSVIGIQTSGISSTIIELLAIKHCGEGTEVEEDPDVDEPGCNCGCPGCINKPTDPTDPDDGKEDPPVSGDTEYSITANTTSGGTVTPGVEKAKSGDVVSMEVTPDVGYRLKLADLVTDADGNKIKVTNSTSFGVFEFRMPESDVTITPVFEKLLVANKAAIPVEKFIGAAKQFSDTFYNQLTENMDWSSEINQLVGASGTPVAGKELTDDNWWFTLTDGGKISADEVDVLASKDINGFLCPEPLKISVGNSKRIKCPEYIIDADGNLKVAYPFIAMIANETGKLLFRVVFKDGTSADAELNVSPIEDTLKCTDIQIPEGMTEESMQISVSKNETNTEITVETKSTFDSSNWAGKMILISLANSAGNLTPDRNPIYYVTRKGWDDDDIEYGFSRNEDAEPDKAAMGFYPIGLTASTQHDSCSYEIATAQRHGVAKMHFTMRYAEGTRK